MKKLRLLMLVVTTLLLSNCNDSSTQQAPEKPKKVDSSQLTDPEKTTYLSSNPTQQDLKTDKEVCEISMGWAPWEPYQYITREGVLTGLDIEIMRATEAELGCKIKFRQDDWAKLLLQLKQGTLDAVASAGMTEARRQYAFYSEPYRSESYAIYVRRDEVERYSGQSVRALLDSRMRLGAVSGYSYGVTISEYQDSEKYQKLFTYNEISEANFLLLFDNKVDGVVADSVVASDMIRRKSWSNQVARLPLVIHSGDVYVMFSKKSVSEEMVQKMNDALAKLKASGDYRRLMELYNG